MQKTNNNYPIGVFDSGIGGTSIAREIKKILPDKKIIFIKDSKNFPYGNKTKDQIIDISIANTQDLINQNCNLVVVACNTATVNAISVLRDKFPEIKFVGTEPAIKPAAEISKKGILILSSPKATQSIHLKKQINKFAANKKVFNIGSLDLVYAIENNASKSEINKILGNIFSNNILKEIDVVVLGCTHFPLIKDHIQNYVGEEISVIDSGAAIAKRINFLLTN